MAEDGRQPSSSKPITTPPSKQTISLPPRANVESFLKSECELSFDPSLGPMALNSSVFSDDDKCKFFAQIPQEAMSSPSASVTRESEEAEIRNSHADDGFQWSDVSALLDLPGFFSIDQVPFGLTYQQALARATFQAGQSISLQLQPDHHSSSSSTPAMSSIQHMPLLLPNPDVSGREFTGVNEPDQFCQSSSSAAYKPEDDGHNWSKYGQKHLKCSEFPRNYYKCTHPNCPVTKKVERSTNGSDIENTYKGGEYNLQPPLPNKRARNPDGNVWANFEQLSKIQNENSQLSGSSGSEEELEIENAVDEYERDPKRRNVEIRDSERSPRERPVVGVVVVQTTSETDLVEDGYRWIKYGKKIVKGGLYPRNYYKCTSPGCLVRKRVERVASNPEDVNIRYEGNHNHDAPPPRIRCVRIKDEQPK